MGAPFSSQTNERSSPDPSAFIQPEAILEQLLACAHSLLADPGYAVEKFCKELRVMSQETLYLSLCQRHPSGKIEIPSLSHPYSFPVQIGNRYYGMLVVQSKDASECVFPFSLARHIASLCALFCYMVEIAAFLSIEHPFRQERAYISLTASEQKVIELMGQGYDSQEIASLLTIAVATVRKHKEHLYLKFEVKNEQQLLKKAFTTGYLYPSNLLVPLLTR